MMAARVSWEPGCLRVEHGSLFAAPVSTDCTGFLQRLCELPEVQSIEIAHAAGQARIRFAESLSRCQLLRRLAAALRAPLPTTDDPLPEWLRHFSGTCEWTRVARRGGWRSVWQLSNSGSGPVCLHHEVMAERGPLTARLCESLAALPQVTRVTPHEPSRALVVDLSAREVDELQLLQLADSIVQDATGAGLPETVRQELVGTLGRVRRGLHLALAGASFGMAIAGAVVPGIPTVPFLLVTSFFLVRSSPALHDRLHRSRLFGPMLRDWQQQRGMRWETKAVSLMIIATTVTLTLLLVEVPLPLLPVMLVFTSLGIGWILRLPTVRVAESPAEGEGWGGAGGVLPATS